MGEAEEERLTHQRAEHSGAVDKRRYEQRIRAGPSSHRSGNPFWQSLSGLFVQDDR
jgi:hypothetical protein